jgi:hypothetical protein
MIPTINDDLQNDFEIEEQPNKTFKLNTEKNTIINYTDELDAVIQAIYLILNTERYAYIIYSWNYGIELNDLFGQPIPFVLPELKRRITEALMQDERIQSVDAFSFEVIKRNVQVTFTSHTIYGDVDLEKVVNI